MPVREMIEAIETAVRSGRIEDLGDAVDWNEIKPDFGAPAGTDWLTHLKAQSAVGDGKDLLETLGRLLSRPPAVLPLGKDLENNRLYVWPSFADGALSGLAGDDLAQLDALAGPATAEMRAKNRYSGWRLVIGPDGVWHAFRRSESD